ncbi:MAG: response regulator [Planctomycetes bacterium]|nr:response regulator [Planctomycetota bacterium]
MGNNQTKTVTLQELTSHSHILSVLQNPICILDQKLKIIFANNKFSELGEVPIQELRLLEEHQKIDFNDVFELNEKSMKSLRDCFEQNHSKKISTLVHSRSFVTKSLDIQITRHKDEEKNEYILLLNLSDNTEAYSVYLKYRRMINLLNIKENNTFISHFKILLVDDDQDIRKLMHTLIEKEGFDLITVDRGQKAFPLLEEITPDLILLDLSMPGMSGVEVLSKLKDNPMHATIPVVIFTAMHDKELRDQCIALGADDFLLKPLNTKLLRKRIYGYLETKQGAIDRYQLQQTQSILSRTLPAVSINEMRNNTEVKPKLYKDVAVIFIDIVGFTEYCATNPHEKIIENFSELVQLYESMMASCGLEKIKTIGDAFLGVGRMLNKDLEDPLDQSVFFCKQFMKKARSLETGWQMRAGVHCGDLMGGIIGKDRLFFDIWGDVVNITSRIQNVAEPGDICMSGRAWHQLVENGKFTYLGKKEMKGINIPLDIYRHSVEML